MSASDYTERVAAVAAARHQLPSALLTVGVHALGAENAILVRFIRDNADLAACCFTSVYGPDWLQRYLEAECFAHNARLT